jgi:hypothetical protein
MGDLDKTVLPGEEVAKVGPDQKHNRNKDFQ